MFSFCSLVIEPTIKERVGIVGIIRPGIWP
jgi:hypothetical protein